MKSAAWRVYHGHTSLRCVIRQFTSLRAQGYLPQQPNEQYEENEVT